MKAISSLDFTKIGPEQQNLSLWSNMWRKMYQNLTFIINGHIGFGDGVHADNIDGVWVNTTTASGSGNFTVIHNLGRIPVGYIVVKASGPVDVYDGTIPPTNTTLTLRASGGATNVRMFIFLFLMALFVTKCEAQPAPKFVQTPVPHWSCPKGYMIEGLSQPVVCTKDKKGNSDEEHIYWHYEAELDKNGKPILDFPKEIKNPTCSAPKATYHIRGKGWVSRLDCNGTIKR